MYTSYTCAPDFEYSNPGNPYSSGVLSRLRPGIAPHSLSQSPTWCCWVRQHEKTVIFCDLNQWGVGYILDKSLDKHLDNWIFLLHDKTFLCRLAVWGSKCIDKYPSVSPKREMKNSISPEPTDGPLWTFIHVTSNFWGVSSISRVTIRGPAE